MRSLFSFVAKKYVLLSLFCLLALVCVAYYGLHLPQKKPLEQAPKVALTVALTHPVILNWPTEVAVSGAIAPWQEVSVSSQLSTGRIETLNVDVGDRVKKGQVLARFNSDEVNVQASKLQASLEKAEAAAEQAKRDFLADKALSQKKLISLQKLQESEVQYKTDEADVKAMQADVKDNQLQQKYTELTAPDDGVISEKNIRLGQVVTQGYEAFRLVRKGLLEWQAEVPAGQISAIKIGQKVTLDGQNSLQGSVRKISPLANENHLFIVYVSLPLTNLVRGGMYVNGHIIIGSQPVLTVPISSLAIQDGKNSLFVLEKHTAYSSVKRVDVTPIMYQGDRVAVSGAISNQDSIVNDGVGFLNDGDSVRVVGDVK